MENNIITAVFNGSKFATTDYLWQYDYGQILKIDGIDLPEMYEVHVSGSASGSAVTVFGDANGIAIPDEYLMKSGSINMYIYLHTGESDGETEYKITIPVKSRAKPTHETPTPVQQSEIEQLIAMLEDLIENYDGSGSGGGSGTDGRGITSISKTSTDGLVDTYTITYTDNTTSTFTVTNGANGSNGQDGQDGQNGTNGISPTVSITEITGGHRLTITDAEHPNGQSVDVMDGTNGTNGQDGQDGDDYVLTAQDKSDIATLVLNQLPVYDGTVVTNNG